MSQVIRVGAAAVLAGMCWFVPCGATLVDPVMEWNDIALSATITAAQGPVPQVRSMTIVQVSVHDAVNSITGAHDTYLAHGPAPAGATAEAAAVVAAHHALVALFPAQKTALDAARLASLAARNLSESDPGIAWGESVAEAIVTNRSTDGASSANDPAYNAPGAGNPGVWVRVGTAAPVVPKWGLVRPWVLDSGSQFRPDGPPDLASGRWARDYNEVKELGSLTSTTRTPRQTEIARFWLASPSVIWNYVARQLVSAHAPSLSDTARVFALMYLASADASIACWDAKYTFTFWRPITAIRNGASDGNHRTMADPAWEPLFPTPQHPEYVSGHSTNSSAMAAALESVFGEHPGVPLVAISPTNPGFPRVWWSFQQGVDEVIDARVYSGIHYRTSDEVGARLGRKVARVVITHALR